MLGQVLSASDRLFLRNFGLAAAFVYLAAAIFSVGYHHPDEHFQILEYVALKIGSADAGNMAWEYHYSMRSWLQPSLLYGLTRWLQWLGFEKPFQWAFAYRLVSGALSFTAIWIFVATCRQWFRSSWSWRFAVLLAFFFWCVPYLAVRTSSEAWSSAFLLLGISACIGFGKEKEVWGFLWAGLLWGLAFEFRFQSAVAVTGAVAYFLVIQKNPRVLYLLPGIVFALFLGLIVDRWGYGRWEVTAWNYFYQNLWVGKVSGFGVSPWWSYPKILAIKVGPPLSLLLIAGSVWAWLRLPRNVLTWMTVPFFVVHSAIGHKEARFLIPILIPVLMEIGLLADQKLTAPLGRLVRLTGGILFALNGILLVASLVKPADVKSDFYSHVSRKLGRPVVIFYKGTHPYGPVSRHKFFWFDGLSFVSIDGPSEFLRAVERDGHAYLFWRADILGPEYRPEGVECELEHATVPSWLYRFDFNGWLRRTPRYNLFLCRKAPLGAASGGLSNQARQKKL
ncbi:MAG: glycosyltransferase family 39 protein [Bdellovibrionales bacterium]|nr:glycosyltransferase family 39 protein [Bdellovibrionales bacterium]